MSLYALPVKQTELKRIASFFINLHEAALCAEDHIFVLSDGRNTCSACGSSSWVRLSDFGLKPMPRPVKGGIIRGGKAR